MSTPDNNKKTIEEVRELTDENLEEVSGGIKYDNTLGNPKPGLNYGVNLTSEAQITPPA
jgi:hypothetical protein